MKPRKRTLVRTGIQGWKMTAASSEVLDSRMKPTKRTQSGVRGEKSQAASSQDLDSRMKPEKRPHRIWNQGLNLGRGLLSESGFKDETCKEIPSRIRVQGWDLRTSSRNLDSRIKPQYIAPAFSPMRCVLPRREYCVLNNNSLTEKMSNSCLASLLLAD